MKKSDLMAILTGYDANKTWWRRAVDFVHGRGASRSLAMQALANFILRIDGEVDLTSGQINQLRTQVVDRFWNGMIGPATRAALNGIRRLLPEVPLPEVSLPGLPLRGVLTFDDVYGDDRPLPSGISGSDPYSRRRVIEAYLTREEELSEAKDYLDETTAIEAFLNKSIDELIALSIVELHEELIAFCDVYNRLITSPGSKPVRIAECAIYKFSLKYLAFLNGRVANNAPLTQDQSDKLSKIESIAEMLEGERPGRTTFFVRLRKERAKEWTPSQLRCLSIFIEVAEASASGALRRASLPRTSGAALFSSMCRVGDRMVAGRDSVTTGVAAPGYTLGRAGSS